MGTLFDSQTGYGDGYVAIGNDADHYFVGQRSWQWSSAKNVDQIDFYIVDITGDVSSKTYNARIYTMSSTNLGTLLGTSDNKTGVTAGAWNSFTFSTAVSISASTAYALVITVNGSDGSNYARTGLWPTLTNGSAATWGSGKSIVYDLTTEAAPYKIYGTSGGKTTKNTHKELLGMNVGMKRGLG